MIVFLDPLNQETGGLDSPLKKYASKVDLTQFKRESMKTLGKAMKYDLVGILSHKKTSSSKKSMYTAVVKKRMSDKQEKQWLSFNCGEMKTLCKKDALKYPAQALFYSLNSKDRSQRKDM